LPTPQSLVSLNHTEKPLQIKAFQKRCHTNCFRISELQISLFLLDKPYQKRIKASPPPDKTEYALLDLFQNLLDIFLSE